MLIKTKEFHERLLHDLADIVIASKKYREQLNKAGSNLEMSYKKQLFSSVKFVGSYPEKPYGSAITDIDFFQIVVFDDKFLARIKQIFENLRYTNFIFVRFYCGEDSDLVPPWIIDAEGGCSFSLEESDRWLKKIKPILDVRQLRSVYNHIWDILSRLSLSLRDLLDVEKLLEPYISISWTGEEIVKGYKTVNNKRFDFLRTLQTYKKKKTLKFVYRYEQEYCLIDMSLKQFQKDVQPPDFATIRAYYENDTYKIIKSFKRYMKPEANQFYKDEFRKAVGNLTGLAGRLELISKLKKYRVLSPDVITRLENDCKEHAQKGGVCTTNEEELKSMIDKNTRHLTELFEKLVQPQFKPEIFIYQTRALEAGQQISKDVIRDRLRGGNMCPFYRIDITDLKRLYFISTRALLDPKKVLECLYEACNMYKKDPYAEAKTLFKDTGLSIVVENNQASLMNGSKVIKTTRLSKINVIQLRVLGFKF